MKYKGPPVAAIFFMTSFNRDRGGHGPLGTPLDPQLSFIQWVYMLKTLTFSNIPVHERSFTIHHIEFSTESSPGIFYGRGVTQHTHRPLYFSKFATCIGVEIPDQISNRSIYLVMI